MSNLTEHSNNGRLVLPEAIYTIDEVELRVGSLPSLERFTAIVNDLCLMGFLQPPKQEIDFGSLRRFAAICPDFGWSRGTPIDRFYLNCFIENIKEQVFGDVLEVGGVSSNRNDFGFIHAATYVTADLQFRPGVDVVGDVNNLDTFPDASFDSILAFNVLEHCEFPHSIVNNFRFWLKPGGKVFCMVPSTQRYHPAPFDFWRPMPDALKGMFSDFLVERFVVYGNCIAAISAMMGIAAEELTLNELSNSNELYPVVLCIVAEKAVQ